MAHEMNFFDLCAACGRAIGRCCMAVWRVIERMIRLTYKYWWIVLTLIILAVAAALYYTRLENRTFKVNAVALLNGPTIQQFEQAYTPLRSGLMLPPEAPITPFVGKVARRFDSFRVIDCLHDETADFIDFKRKIQPTDTTNVQMQDRLCLQFRIKTRDMHLLPEIEHALMVTLNANPAMQQAYVSYLRNLQAEVAFNHAQALKLDSLTSCYYFYPASPAKPMAYNGNGVNFYGDREIQLFLKDIYEQQAHLQRWDYRLQLATAPVTLENHFAVDPKPVHGRKLFVFLFFLMGWIGGCLIAELIDKRKALSEWLKA
ncbi:MAG: hypothetical protein IKP02_01990 [Paludibacteraceae bacterium]|nr:hypothetical protein [Paludibacteraceae bacterium]